MRILLVVICLVAAAPAQGQIYRWIEPESGSVKFSNTPPPWLREEDRVGPAVEVIQPPGAPKPPADRPFGVAPGSPAALAALVPLEARRKDLMQTLSGLPPADFNRAGSEFQRQLEAYRAVRAELDRLDPAGAQRRRTEEGLAFEKLLSGLGAQPGAPPAAR